MNMLLILAAIVLILLALSLVRVGGIAEYTEGGVSIRVRVGSLRIQVFPIRKKKTGKAPKPKREKKEKPKKEEEPEPKSGGNFDLLKKLLPLVADTAGQLKRKIRIDRLYLDFTAAASDPAKAAMHFGYANMAIGMIWPFLENNFMIKDRRIRTAVDFNRSAPVIYLNAAFSLTIGQGLSLAAHLMVRFLKIYSAYKAADSKPKAKQKEAV